MAPALERAAHLTRRGLEHGAKLLVARLGESAPRRELDRPERRAEVSRGLEALREEAAGFANVSPALDELLLDAGVAWQAYACALLADEL